MVQTKVADVVVPELFNPYLIERTAAKSELIQSGIVEASPEFDALASSGGRMLQMPFWKDLSGDDELIDDETDLSIGQIQSGQDAAVLLMRGKTFGASDLSAALAGDDPMAAIADLFADYWNRRRQVTLLSILEGVFGAASMAGNLHDITGDDDDTWTAETFIDATHKLGDSEGKLTAAMVHSATLASLKKQDLVEFALDSESRPTIPVYNGRRLVVDDGCPESGGDYTSYIFGQGAFALGNGAPKIPTEVAREPLKGGGIDYIVNRQHFVLHPRGVAWQDAVVTLQTPRNPSNADLATAANWVRAYEAKNVRMVAFKHKLE